MPKTKDTTSVADIFQDAHESVDDLINRKRNKEESMSKEIAAPVGTAIVPGNWLMSNIDLPSSDEGPPKPLNSGVFPFPFPLVKMNQKDENGSRTPFFVCEKADDREAFLVPGLPLRDAANRGKTPPTSLRVVPICTYNRHTMWENNRMEFEHPTSFGPFSQTGDEGRDELRVVWYDIDRDSFYFIDLGAMGSRWEAQTFDYYAIKGMVKAGVPPYHYVYNMTTIRKDGKKGAYYQLRFVRAADVITPQYTKLANDGRDGPAYEVELLSSLRTKENPQLGEEILARLESRIGSTGNALTWEMAAIHLLGMTGMDAMKWIRKLQNAEATVEDALSAPRGICSGNDSSKNYDSTLAPFLT